MAFSCRLRLDWAVDKIEGGDCDVSGSIIGIGAHWPCIRWIASSWHPHNAIRNILDV